MEREKIRKMSHRRLRGPIRLRIMADNIIVHFLMNENVAQLAVDWQTPLRFLRRCETIAKRVCDLLGWRLQKFVSYVHVL